MVKIHGFVYIILSAGILFFSYKLDPQKFRLFIWIGYLFLVVGIAKLVIEFITKKKEGSGEKKVIRSDVYRQQMGRGNIRQQPISRGNIHQQRRAEGNVYGRQEAARYCFRCGSRLIGHENFCSMCGQNLRI